MAKRLVKSRGLWPFSFFKSYDIERRHIYQFIWDHCDSAGIWLVEMDQLELYTGIKLTVEQMPALFRNEMVLFDRATKIFLPHYFRENCAPAKDTFNAKLSAIKTLTHYGLLHYVLPDHPDANSSVNSQGSLFGESYESNSSLITNDAKADNPEHSIILNYIKSSFYNSSEGGVGETQKNQTPPPQENARDEMSQSHEATLEKLYDPDSPLPPEPLPSVPVSAQIDFLVVVWGKTLRHWKNSRDPKLDAPMIASLLQRYKLQRVKTALFGQRFEPKTQNYDPADRVYISRLLDVKHFNRAETWGQRKRDSPDETNSLSITEIKKRRKENA